MLDTAAPFSSPCLHNEKQPITCMLQSAAFSPCCVRRTEHEPNITAQKLTDCNSNPSIMGWAVLAYATQAITPAPSCDVNGSRQSISLAPM